MLVIVGESAAGKSSVAEYLVNNFNFSNIISYTTRQPREDEVDGIDYHFITESKFQELKRQGFFAETAVYGGKHYGSAKEDLVNAPKSIRILTPHGIRQIQKQGISICVVYIKVPRRDRLIKLLQRGDCIEEAYNRNLSDVGRFDGMEDEADLVIENEGYKKSIKEIAEEIRELYEHTYL